MDVLLRRFYLCDFTYRRVAPTRQRPELFCITDEDNNNNNNDDNNRGGRNDQASRHGHRHHHHEQQQQQPQQQNQSQGRQSQGHQSQGHQSQGHQSQGHRHHHHDHRNTAGNVSTNQQVGSFGPANSVMTNVTGAAVSAAGTVQRANAGDDDDDDEDDDADQPSNVAASDTALPGAQPAQSATENLLQRLSSTDANRRCWVCFASEHDDDAPDDEWLHPCNCKKSMKWVHMGCLNRWVDEKQDGNAYLPVKCPFCLYVYEFEYPGGSILAKPINFMENWIIKATNNVPAFVILRLGSTIAEIAYFAADLDIVQKIVLWVLIEMTIPLPWTLLILLEIKIRDWEMNVVRATAPSNVVIPRREAPIEAIQNLDMGDFIRVRLIPCISIVTGEALFHDSIDGRVPRALAGCCAFLGIRACIRIPYRRNQYIMASSRRVKNKTSDDSLATGPARAPAQRV